MSLPTTALIRSSSVPALRQRWCQDRITVLTHNGNVYAMTMLVLSQVIYLNLHYIVGACIASLAIFSLMTQIFLSSLSQHALLAQKTERVKRLLYWHFVFNNLVMFIMLPFLIWTVVLMIRRAETT